MAQASASAIQYSSHLDMDRVYTRILILDREERDTHGQRVLRFSDNTSRYSSHVCDCRIIFWWKSGEKVMPTKEEEILRILSNSSIDFDFIKDREGYSLEGYVPEPDKSQSGVTVASGFDLGQKQKSDLQGLPKTLQDKLTKYLGKKKQQAVEELQKFPLIITDEEAKLLNKKAKEDSVYDLTTKWKNKTGKNFSELTPSQQTAIASVSFQYGDLESATPNFWNSVTNNQWGDAISELRNFKDAYPTRRNLEADLLEQSTYETNQAQRPLTSIPGINEDLKPLPMPIIDIEFAD